MDLTNLSNSLRGYEAARHRACLLRRTDRGMIVVSGTDRASYLQGLLTNDIAALQAGDDFKHLVQRQVLTKLHRDD